jgi:hypothetical protein
VDVKLVMHNKERMQRDGIFRAVNYKVVPRHAVVVYGEFEARLHAF